MSIRSTVVLMLAALILIARPDRAAAQAAGAPHEVLSKPAETYPEPFSSIAGLRELSDGRVVVADRLERAVRIVDFGNGASRDVGRPGQGPGEYQMPGDLSPLPGDSTLLVDFGNMRMTAMGPEGRLRMQSEPLLRPDGTFVRPEATDARGRVYFSMGGMVVRTGGAEEEPGDSVPVARLDRASGAIDTVAMLLNPRLGAVKVSGGGGTFSFQGPGVGPFAAADSWGVTADGRVAIARSAEYRIDWRDPDGSSIRGPAVEYDPVPITEEDKQAWAERFAGGTVVTIRGRDGSAGGRSIRIPAPDIEQMEWPEVKPAFPRDGVSVTPEGEVWVQRYVAHGEAETFDVFDGAGRRVARVTLPAGRTLFGFGNGTLYAYRADSDDLQWLERYER